MRVSETAALVTGAASGLGAATAAHLAKRGASVFALDLPDEAARIPATAGVTPVAADVTSEEQLAAALERVSRAPLPLRIVVHCAGIDRTGPLLGDDGPHPLALFRRIVEVNLVGTFNVLRLAADLMSRSAALDDGGRGVIVTTASIFAYEGQAGHTAYAASKGGVAALTLPAARDLARHGIRVVCLAPGIFLTPMVETLTEEMREAGLAEQFMAGLAGGPLSPARFGRPEEFAAFAASVVEHDYLNGEVVRLDGGLRVAFGGETRKGAGKP